MKKPFSAVLLGTLISLCACSGPFGIAVGKDAILAKVRITELEYGHDKKQVVEAVNRY